MQLDEEARSFKTTTDGRHGKGHRGNADQPEPHTKLKAMPSENSMRARPAHRVDKKPTITSRKALLEVPDYKTP